MKEELKYEYVLPSDKFDTDAYFAEMASIVADKGYNISVNNELKRLSIAYFKVYNNQNIMASKKVARLHFKDQGMEFHRDPLNKKAWVLGSKEKKDIKDILMRNNKYSTSSFRFTNWQSLCFQWNSDNNLIPPSASIEEYLSGIFDDKYSDKSTVFVPDHLKSAYVPSTQEIPETWRM